ncbi:MAG: PRC-barrel domain-containing protein [Chthoniobacterales bacterium]
MIAIRSKFPALLPCLAVLLLCLPASRSLAQSHDGVWDEVIGKKVLNRQGVTLGHVSDTAIDLEAGRYVGLIITSGGFLGIGSTTHFVPFGVMMNSGIQGKIMLDMDEAKFRNAPTVELSKAIGPPDAVQMKKIYDYYGVRPYFTTEISAHPREGETLQQLGFVQPGAKILMLPVENLQGKTIGTVVGLHNLDQVTGRVGGVVIAPTGWDLGNDGGGDKVVLPEALRYNYHHKALRLNDHYQEFKDSPKFAFTSGRNTLGESPQRPGTPSIPVVQGNTKRDKDITLEIKRIIHANKKLSNYAETLEVGTVNGKTIIRGRVLHARDRDRIIASAEGVAGRGNVTCLIEVRSTTANEQAIDL